MNLRAQHGIANVLPLAAYCALIFSISAMTAPPAPEYPFEWGDKINHALAYAIMFLLAVRAARVLHDRSARERILPALLFCALYGATDEVHQLFVVGRSCDIFDWLADVVGAGACAAALPSLLRLRVVGLLVIGEPQPRAVDAR